MKLVERSDSGSKKTRLTSYQSSFNKKNHSFPERLSESELEQ